MRQLEVDTTAHSNREKSTKGSAMGILSRVTVLVALLAVSLVVLHQIGRAFDVPFIDNTIRAEWVVAIHVGRAPNEVSGAEPTVFVTRDDVPLDDVLGVADPFLLNVGGRLVLLAEIIVRDPDGRFGERGLIGAFESRDGGTSWRWLGPAIESSDHFSYPFPVHTEDGWFLVPESGDTGETVLYRAEEFPTSWVRERVLLEGNWGDPTIFEHEGAWFLFAVDTTGEGYGEDLHLFTSDSLLDPWVEHPDSPIVRSDASKARPAGPIFADAEGRLWRPAQQNANSYGEQVRAFEILELNPDRYREAVDGQTIASATGEGWNASGMHHISMIDDGEILVSVVDGFRLVQERTFGF